MPWLQIDNHQIRLAIFLRSLGPRVSQLLGQWRLKRLFECEKLKSALFLFFRGLRRSLRIWSNILWVVRTLLSRIAKRRYHRPLPDHLLCSYKQETTLWSNQASLSYHSSFPFHPKSSYNSCKRSFSASSFLLRRSYFFNYLIFFIN